MQFYMKKKKKKKKVKKLKEIETKFVSRNIKGTLLEFIYRINKNNIIFNNRIYLKYFLISYLMRKHGIRIKIKEVYPKLEKISELFIISRRDSIKKEIGSVIYDECLHIKELVFAKRFYDNDTKYFYESLKGTLLCEI